MSTSLFGTLIAWSDPGSVGFNGLQKANRDFLQAIVRYSLFDELHFFVNRPDIDAFKQYWEPYIREFGAGKVIQVLPAYQLPGNFECHHYSVFHSGDPYISNLVHLRESHAAIGFPITGRAHTLSDDSSLSKVRELLLAPMKRCDAILCSSKAQQKVMERLLSSASAMLNDAIGVTVPYRGEVTTIPLGVEPPRGGVELLTSGMKQEVRKSLGIKTEHPIILCLGRLSPSDKMDLQPLFFALNDLVEERRINGFQLVVAGTGDASSEYVQSLLAQAYTLNIEDNIRFELSVDEERKKWLLASSDLFISLADNVQESFGIAPVEAMQHGLPVVLSDWNGYKELVEDKVSGYLIPTLAPEIDAISRSTSLIHRRHANFIQAQTVSLDSTALKAVLASLINNEALRESIGTAGRLRAEKNFSWPDLIDEYQTLVKRLGQDKEMLKMRSGYCSGMPYSRVFGHYSSSKLTNDLLLKTSERGLRVVIGSETSTSYESLDYLQDDEQTKNLLTKAINGELVSELIKPFSSASGALFVVAHLLKYELLETASAKYSHDHASLSRYIELNSKELNVSLHYPEQRRSVLLKPYVNHFLNTLFPDDVENNFISDKLIKSVGNNAVHWMDARLLQAIGWFSEARSIKGYGKVISLLEKEGGCVCLLNEYPLWRRSVRKEYFRNIRLMKQLIRRVYQDLSDINGFFFHDNPEKAKCLVSVTPMQGDDKHPVYKLLFDNGEQVIYKNRDINCDKKLSGVQGSVFATLNNWLNDKSALGVYKVLPKAEGTDSVYGYSEFLAAQQPEDLEQYFYRLGLLTGASLLMGLFDVNHQNVFVKGDTPYLIDGEMIFHGSVLQQLENELKKPMAAFVRGVEGSSFDKTGLMNLWESFYTYKTCLNSVHLKNGEIIGCEPETIHAVKTHFYKKGDRHCLDGEKPALSSEYIEQFVEGVEQLFSVVSENIEEWKKLLSSYQGLEVRYSPMLDSNEARKVLRDNYVSVALQKIEHQKVENYFDRMAFRITKAGELSQRWLDTEWQEPINKLAAPMSRGWQNLEQTVFVYKVGDRSVHSRTYLGRSGQPVPDYFNSNYLQKALEIADQLVMDSEERKRFTDAFTAAVRQWLNNECVAGKGLPQSLRDQLSGKKP